MGMDGRRNVVIFGKNGFIGTNLYRWLNQWPEEYRTELWSARDGAWEKKDFSHFDVVINAAGLAHITHLTPDMEETFFSANRDLPAAICARAKAAGVKHFIHFSSMNVYGDCCEKITDRTKTAPVNFYGKSKLEGDLRIHAMADEGFVVASIRPPFVYGKGCPGNYNTIRKIARMTPFFPTFSNAKSMIYIDNLCEYTRLIVDERKGGGIYSSKPGTGFHCGAGSAHCAAIRSRNMVFRYVQLGDTVGHPIERHSPACICG